MSAGSEGGKDVEHWFSVGTPIVPEGKLGHFWCIVKNTGAKYLSMRYLFYGNKYVMPLSDDCYDAPDIAEPVGDDGDYAWTGWFERSCDQCETQWSFSGEVIGWKELPKITEAHAAMRKGEAPKP